MTSIYRLILLLTVFGVSFQYAASQGLKGRITNSRGEPLPYATIYIKETRMGSATNLDGIYDISLDEGTYSIIYQLLGYKPLYQTLTIGNSVVENNITLTEQTFEMPEIVVRATDKDRAYYIMRKAIGMAPYHLRQVKSYEAEVYIKGGAIINKIPRMIKKRMNTDINQSEIEEGHYYFSESVNVITFTSPDNYVHRVVSTRSNIPIDEASSSPMDFIEASFYQPIIVDIAISPLAPNAFSHYNFKFLGSTRQGEYSINKIQVIPKRKSQQLFTGTIFIVGDEWAIQSLDLTNENMIGKIKVKQLYMPVEDNIWMPVSHDFKIDISIVGVKAEASYTSSVKYTTVTPDVKLTSPSDYMAAEEPVIKNEDDIKNQKSLDEIEEILSKEKISARDMTRLAKLNEKVSDPKEKESLEVKDKTKYIFDKDASKKDSIYWEKVRPIPLTTNERASVPVSAPIDTALRHQNSITVSIGGKGNQNNEKKEKSKFSKLSKAAISGKKWDFNKDNSLTFDGLASVRTFSFNTVDGFTAGTGLTWSTKTGENSKLNINPSIRYAFNRKDLMWSINTGISLSPEHQSWLSLRAGSITKDFASSGINPFINTVSSLMFRYNWMKLYKSDFISLRYSTEVVNGLRIGLAAGWERRKTLENVTDFSIFSPARDYTLNIPDNPFVNGEVNGFNAFKPANHDNYSFTAELTYTPRQRYKINNSSKINLPTESPVFHLLWKHGYNTNDSLSGHYDFFKGDISMKRDLGAMRKVNWHVAAGGFLNRQNLQLQDLRFFNTQSSPILINNYSDAFLLKNYYAVVTPTFFSEAHIKYTTACLLVKRMPIISKTLMRENVNLAWLYTPEYKHYTEVGYSISEIFLIAEAGIYAGFNNFSFDGVGVRFIINLH